ncbi:MAG TPA: hypothetical protein HPP50_03795 [Rhodospirillaceae bacterium]|nr:hypothetical protein [Rhodospirillales bacterium]HIJ44063.1 hypothetical protein [Rhodospirillaceae bacterium]MDP7215422.1 hypothetical protein [Rhodospirillales bacterium]HIJ45270.1 hypothetical protein [Rhodospirillaceae bacterium]HIJ93351.1 hypothetical protein [Rhodospirillaceae bacterium]
MTDKAKQKAVDENYEAFKKMLPSLLEEKEGKFVVLRNREMVASFDTIADAIVFASRTYEDGLFSIQQVKKEAVDLGYFSHAMCLHIIRSEQGSDLGNRAR